MGNQGVSGDGRKEFHGWIEQQRFSAVKLESKIEVAQLRQRPHPRLEFARTESCSEPRTRFNVAVRTLQVAAAADQENDGQGDPIALKTSFHGRYDEG
jgi:hypothetical protein